MAVEVVVPTRGKPLPGDDEAGLRGQPKPTADKSVSRSGPRWMLPALMFAGIVALLACLLAGGTVGAAAVSGLGGRQTHEFTRVGGVWGERPVLELPPRSSVFGNFRPWSVTLHGDTAVVVYTTAAPYAVSFLYRRVGGSWYKVAQVHPASSSYTPAGIAVQHDQILQRLLAVRQRGRFSEHAPGLSRRGLRLCRSIRVAAGPAGVDRVDLGGTMTLSWTPGTGGTATSYRLEAGSGSSQSNLFSGDVGNVLQLSGQVPPGDLLRAGAGRERHGGG